GVLESWEEMRTFASSLVQREVVPILKGVDDGTETDSPMTPAELAQFRATKAKQIAVGKLRGELNRERDRRIIEQAGQMREDGDEEPEIRARLAERNGISPKRIWQILKQAASGK